MIHAGSKEEILAKESYYIRTLKCVNITIPDRTPKEWHHEYYQKNKEKYSKLQKEYYIVNKEYIDERNKKYHEAHKEQLNVYYKQYREENKEHKKEIDKAYREANKEKIKERKTQPFLCECGCTIKLDEKARHRKSQKHINLMKPKEEQIQL